MRIVHPVVNGRWLSEVGSWSGLKFSHGPHGALRASWQMREGIRHHNIRAGALVTLMQGGLPVWRGFLNEPGRDGAMSGLGLWEEAKGAAALDGTNNPTSEPRDAVGRAVLRGALRWGSREELYPGEAKQWTDAPYPNQSVADLLDKVATDTGTRWFIDDYSAMLRTAPDPTVPKWMVPHAVAGSGLTPADDNVATHLIGSFFSAPGTPGTAIRGAVGPSGLRIEQHVNLSDRGFITQAEAEAILDAMLGTGVGQIGWADGLSLGRGDLFTLGGSVASPSLPRPGQMIRLAGVWDDRLASPTGYTDVVIEETEYDEDGDRVQVKPKGLQARTLAGKVNG